jgi:hypothetical protein
MKILVTAAALATLLASPVFAQTQSRQAPAYQSVTRVAPAPQPVQDTEEEHVYAASVGFGEVIVDGMPVGRDPDPNVRLMLQRDYDANEYGGGE